MGIALLVVIGSIGLLVSIVGLGLAVLASADPEGRGTPMMFLPSMIMMLGGFGTFSYCAALLALEMFHKLVA